MIFEATPLALTGIVIIIGMFASISVTLAMLSAPQSRHGRIHRAYLLGGLFVSFIGVGLMAFGAWSAREDSRYGVFAWAGFTLATLMGAGLLLFGLGPFASRLLETLHRHAERLPLPLRLAARDLAGRRTATAPAITLTAMATAFGVALTIIAVGATAQSRAAYLPRARPGALLVSPLSSAGTDAVRAAIQRELPGVPWAERQVPRHLPRIRAHVDGLDRPEGAVYPDEVIGDEALLRYLTGDRSTPYDEGTAVVITTTDVKADSVKIVTGEGDPLTTNTIPAIVARTVDPHMATVFVPAKVVRDLGHQLEPGELIVDPSLHRTSASEQERLDDRLGDIAETSVERGFQPWTGWTAVVAAVLLLALGGALATGGGRATSPRVGRVLRRAGDGSAATLRWFGACRAGLSAACGTVLGAVAGCPIGMLLIWPLTAATTWDSPPRVPFPTPWPVIAAVAAGLPVAAAALGGLLVRAQTGSGGVHPREDSWTTPRTFPR
ncbi:hypothetical protein E1292_30690 [Nonomuraea deserti]|uniref:FtsX-like permease family protein n=1 Tax=Nonomuraea deserti TaxID=1848322 RepID=A0A4V2Y9G6_9ACTN|nr:hypothetical protein [Nonomuraea deserti]TDC99765.1 hypothetical protein E1292_30690 [Nonomuraea deserti]